VNALVPVAFNLLLNAVSSFVVTLGLVALAVRVTSLGPGRARLLLWALPFLKVLWDLASGIPRQSFLWVHALGAKQELGGFALGFGLRPARPPFIHAVLSSHYAGLSYSQSAADLLFRALEQKLASWAPALLVCVLLGGALARVALQALSISRFRQTSRGLLASASLVARVRVGLREVCVYSSKHYEGAPYAAGVVHPYVLFSERSLWDLDARARDAAIQHELSHIERHDPLLIGCVTLLGCVLWFLPGRAWLTRRLCAEIELGADQRALERGADATALADALVSVGEGLYAAPADALGLGPHKHLLRARVERLLAERPSPQRRLRSMALHALVVLGVVPSILYSVFFGN
jgi:hypothetical protein